MAAMSLLDRDPGDLPIGSEAKSERARRLKMARRAAHQHPGGKRGTGRRFLDQRELDEWDSKLNAILHQKRRKLSLKG